MKIIYGSSVRSDGNMALHINDDINTVVTNRINFLTKFDLKLSNLICMNQTHSNNVKIVSTKDMGAGAKNQNDAIADCDAIITTDRELILAVMSADCVPIILYDENMGIAAVVHAGWKGTAGEIVKKTLYKMIDEIGACAESIKVVIYPAIGECCYEVGSDTASLCGCKGSSRLDLKKLNYEQIVSIGIPDKNISISKECTSCSSSDFFSYRADNGNTGRLMSFVVLKQ